MPKIKVKLKSQTKYVADSVDDSIVNMSYQDDTEEYCELADKTDLTLEDLVEWMKFRIDADGLATMSVSLLVDDEHRLTIVDESEPDESLHYDIELEPEDLYGEYDNLDDFQEYVRDSFYDNAMINMEEC